MFGRALNTLLEAEIYFFSPIFNISKPRTAMQKKVRGDHRASFFFFSKPDYLVVQKTFSIKRLIDVGDEAGNHIESQDPYKLI